MHAGTFRWLVLAIGVLAFAGCQSSQSAGTNVSPMPPTQPFVFYDETGDPSERTAALSETELREVIDWVATQTSDPVWLIRVRPSPEKGIRNDTVAYLVPDEATSRIRVGRAYDVPASRKLTAMCSLWRYAQVSKADHNFAKELTRPPATEIPFEWPMIVDPNSKKDSPMSKEEVTSIVDFVCQPSNYEKWAGEDALRRANLSLATYERPILKIERWGNKIIVTFGFLHGHLWGHGHVVTIERTAGGYRITEVCGWVS
jgi:hypothetical protein